MPRRPNRLPGQIFDIENLSQARELIKQINAYLDVLQGNSGTQSYMDAYAKLPETYKELRDLSHNYLKNIKDINIETQKAIGAQVDLADASIISTEKQLELAKQQAVLTAQEIQRQNELKQLQKEQNKLEQERIEQLKQRREEVDSTEKIIAKAQKEYEKGKENVSLGNIGSYLVDKYKTGKVNKLVSSEYTSNLSKGMSDEDALLTARETAVEKLKDSGKKYEASALIIQTAANTFKKAADMIFGLMGQGITNQYNAYNSTFSNFAARTGVTRNTYYNEQIGARNTLSSRGLFDNVATSEVMSMWNDLANIGMSSENIFASAIDNVVTNKIVPYLNTTTQEFNFLNTKLDNQFVKDIRGISKTNLEIAGNNYMTQDLLQMIIDEVQPMSDEALQNLAQGSAEFTSTVNALRSQGMSEEAAKSYATQLFKNQRYSNQVLSSGSVSERLGLLQNLSSGINIYDPTQWNNAIGQYVDVSGSLMGGMPGYGSTYGGLVTNIVGGAFGESYDRSWFATSANRSGTVGTQTASDVDNKVKDIYTDATIQAMNEFTNGDYQTEKDKQEKFWENTTTELATIKEQLGHWSDVVDVLLKGIGNLFALWIGKNLIGGSLGKGVQSLAGTGAGQGLLAAGGGIALGVAAVNAITGAITNAHNAKEQQISGQTTQLLNDEFASEIASGEMSQSYINTLGKISGLTGAGSNASPFEIYGQGVTQAAEDVGYGWSQILGTLTAKDKSEHAIKTLKSILTQTDVKKSAQEAFYVAFAMLADSAGVLSQISGYLGGLTRADIKEYLKNQSMDGTIDEGYWNNVANELVRLYPSGVPWVAVDKQQKTINWNNYHRNGLNEVPYDNYPALLHEGEAVLTASTANELRSLVDEYRATNSQSINLDTAIKEQTIALTEKMDKIISTLQFGGLTSNIMDSKATSNMLSLRNINAFTNN